MLLNIALFSAFIGLLVLVCYMAARRFQRNQFTITHIDNTHVTLYNAARNQTVRVTLIAIMDDPMQTSRLERHFQHRLGGPDSLLLRGRSAVKNSRCSTYIPGNAQRVHANAVSASRHEATLWLTYRQVTGLSQRTIHIEQTFTL